MASWATIGFGIYFRAIKRSYQESRKAFEAEIASTNARWTEYEAELKKNPALIDDEDPHGYGEHLGELIYESEESLRVIREAFAMTLYHFWEKSACEYLHIPYEQAAIFAAAKQDSRFTVDEAAINELRLIVNCIKHDAGEKLYAVRPDLFDPQLVPASGSKLGWHAALRFSHSELERSFDAVWASGPKSPPSRAHLKVCALKYA